MTYTEYKINLTEGQKQSLAKAYKNRSGIKLRLKNEQLAGNFPLLLTKTQINAINKAAKLGVGMDITISKTQMTSQGQSGGFLGALAGLAGRLLPMATQIVPKILSPLATGALSGLASTGIGKLFGQGNVKIPAGKKKMVLKKVAKDLTCQQCKQLSGSKGDCMLTLTPSQQQNGGFLGMLASIGIPLLASLFSGKGLRVDRGNGLRVDRGNGLRIGKGKKKKFENIPISNFDILSWADILGIKNLGVYSRNEVPKGLKATFIINLDDHTGPGTHWCAVYKNEIYFDPFGIAPPHGLRHLKYNTIQYQDKQSVLCGYFALFFIRKMLDGISPYDFLYKVLKPYRTKENEVIIKKYFTSI